MSPFRRSLFDDIILPGLLAAPESQISEVVRERVRAFGASAPDARAIYNFLDALHAEPVTEISSFVHVLCDVRQFYEEPVICFRCDLDISHVCAAGSVTP